MRKLGPVRDVHMLGFQGVQNFRELGGYVSRNGRSVRWQKLFRSGHLAEITESDLQQIASLDIIGRVDLRSVAEREIMASKWPSGLETQVLTLEHSQEGGNPARSLLDRILLGQVSVEEARSRMLEEYTCMPEDYAEIIAKLLVFIADHTEGAVLVHCTAGKDRTGFVIAVLLAILEVPIKVILQDYLLSNRGFDGDTMLAQIKSKHPDVKRDDRFDVLKLLLHVESDFLMEALGSMRRNWGGIDGYLNNKVGATPELLEQVRRNLLSSGAGN